MDDTKRMLEPEIEAVLAGEAEPESLADAFVFSAERAAEIALNETTVANGIGAIAAIAVAGAMKVAEEFGF